MRVWVAVLICASLAACATAATQIGDDSGTGSDASSGTDATKGNTDAGDAKASCTPPTVYCANSDAGNCFDLTTSPNHCGACTTACTTGDAGGLTPGSDDNPDSGLPPQDSGTTTPWSVGTATCTSSACGIQCPSGLTECSDDICYDTRVFHEHCGDCNTSCATTEYCAGGHCCATGTEYCGAACTDVLSDTSNCGSCGHVCTGGQTCSNGTCTTCTNKNVALTATATISGGGSVSPYLPSDANDGVLETSSCSAYAWITAGNSPGTDWIQYTWTTAQSITKMHMDTTSGTVADSCGNIGRTLGAATIEWWNGSSWVTDGSVSGKLDDWDYTFTTTISTTQVRLYAIYCTNTMGQESNPQVYEWQVTGCN